MENKQKEQLIKYLLIGESTVGKTCLILRYTDNEFFGNQISTIGVEFKRKTITYCNEKIILQIWDTAGQDRFGVLTRKFCKHSNVILIVYDVSIRKTFEKITEWISNIEENASRNVLVVLVGNKCDLETERQVSCEEGRQLADQYKLAFYETSALKDINISQVFEHYIPIMNARAKEDAKKRIENKLVKSKKFCG